MNNIWVTWGDVFNASLQSLWWSFIQFAPKLVIAILLFIIGWVLGSLVAKAFEQVIGALKVDNLLKSVGGDHFLRSAGMNLDSGYFIGQVVKWFIVIVFLLPSLTLVFGPNNEISAFLKDDVLGYLPHVVVAAFILVIATLVSEGLKKAVTASARTMNLSSANLLGAIAKYSVWVFALIIALGQLGVAGDYMFALFDRIITMVALAAALAFGLGGKDAAARFIGKLSDEVRN